MSEVHPITVVSSYSEDRVVDDSGEILRISPGGPALFITDALTREGVQYELVTADQLDVEILSNEQGEFGRVPIKPGTRQLSEVELSEWTIISSILNEWEIDTSTQLPPYTFIDLQGFVRDGEDFGKKRVWDLPAELRGQVFCLKGTKQEMEFIPAELLEDQKARMLVITDAENDVTVFFEGKEYQIPLERVAAVESTIGAGDTFLTYLVLGIARGQDPLEATTRATAKTREFLERNYG